MPQTQKNDLKDLDLGSDLHIVRIDRRTGAPGSWVTGTLHSHRFEALVFPEHAQNPEYEIPDSRISKLWIQRLEDGAVVFSWDRGRTLRRKMRWPRSSLTSWRRDWRIMSTPRHPTNDPKANQ